MRPPQPALHRSERRTQTRLQTQFPVEVSVPDWSHPVAAANRDLSWGGACFVLPVLLPRETDAIRVSFPVTPTERLAVEASLVRRKPLGDDRLLVAVRFSSLAPGDQRRLEQLLGSLVTEEASGSPQKPGPLVRELEVAVNEAAELRQMLTEVARGRLTVTVFDSYAPNQSIVLLIAGATPLASIRLRARVSAISPIEGRQAAWPALHRLILNFEHPIGALRALVDFLVDQLPAAPGARAPAFSDVPEEWLCSPSFAPDDGAIRSVGGVEPESGPDEPPEFPYARRY